MQWFATIACLILATASFTEFIWRKSDVHPESHMNVSQIVSFRRYPSEEYEVLTDDGYYLILNRIPGGGKKHVVAADPKPAVLLLHGLLGDSKLWLTTTPNNSFPFILADAGYDVWLGNNRGTTWSNKHQTLSADQEEFWDFSFHEMAMYDLPAMINFILKKTGQKQLYYIGHSQGTAIGFIAFSAIPELSQKIKMFFALAPVISVKHSPTPAVKVLYVLPENALKIVLGNKSFFLLYKPIKEFLIKLCSYSFMSRLCSYAIFSFGGFNGTNLNVSRTDVYMSCYPDRSSVKNILHWRQTGESGLCRQFDYRSENEAKYNQTSPPSYKIEDMVVPTVIWSGGKDLIAGQEDTKILLSHITDLTYYRNLSDWNHWDFILGLNAPQTLYYKIIELMERSLDSSSFASFLKGPQVTSKLQ
ncbi:lipase member M-like [Hemicordylus capensis]|uniref:lipase member M-like n=1 Tax=Hemicordylus capensis TaxID=884348 RepID=UPI00230255E8|nr:lipase member M-like [Hemicordylus capensis]XP_053165573.1 lipase member M-like [Hemicordylus capensis]